jgi:hypothetical protein
MVSATYVIFIVLLLVNATEHKSNDGIIHFCFNVTSPTESNITQWLVQLDSIDSIDVTINCLDLDEAAGDYLIISPGKI